jgi:hypothetical protein
LLKAYPKLPNAHSKYGWSCSIYIVKADCVAVGAYTLKEMCLRPNVKMVVNNMEELDEPWDTLEKYMTEVKPIIKFKIQSLRMHCYSGILLLSQVSNDGSQRDEPAQKTD